MNKNIIILPLLLCLSLILSFLGLYIVFKFDEELQYNNKEYCYKEYCLFSNSSEEADNDFFGSSPMVEDDNSNLLVSALSSIMKYPIYNYEVDNDDDDNDDVKKIWQEVKFDEIYKLNLIGDKLSLDKSQLYYNHNNNNNNDGPFNIKIKKFYGRTLHLKDLYRSTTIKELKLRIKKVLKADPIIQKIVFNGRKVADGDKDLQYYGIKKNSVLHLDLLPFSSSPSSSFKDKKDKKDRKKKNIIFKRYINPNFINKLYDNAFTLYNDFDDNKYSSSSSQCNWIKFAIDNKQKISKGWKISYHGTSKFKHNSIANQGNILLRQLQYQENHLSHPHPHPQNLNNLIKFSDGIFTTPDLQLAELYSKIFYFKGEKYKVIFQHLVKEKSLVKIKRFDIRNDRLDEYWVSPCENELKPFGVLVKKVENCG